MSKSAKKKIEMFDNDICFETIETISYRHILQNIKEEKLSNIKTIFLFY